MEFTEEELNDLRSYLRILLAADPKNTNLQDLALAFDQLTAFYAEHATTTEKE